MPKNLTVNPQEAVDFDVEESISRLRAETRDSGRLSEISPKCNALVDTSEVGVAAEL
ncbi:hypothetical protein BY996DRAFT_6499201 [Phakopsora pachyrhizi]|uniref:Uncharacterized protein n=1 Tax=Phakopsora pachyrhizi TaxID=170000 RepID=A0AAV0B5H1_PHAPC|nr:hypothetical protein BY996DRAFT_6499201 [Phakopsora pachyrhizi]CAH7677523.1 hypothetical protein PPACK8108_LOCUS12688 [Phakopsora pachyrhizi]